MRPLKPGILDLSPSKSSSNMLADFGQMFSVEVTPTENGADSSAIKA
ncbi:hypothetical protein ThidrDRAFT_1820 [Thiorhodococcus drewsii AZ1]|uniref:Uncharacterized protein n=1 Tax=Thiorhodococcus drewsii AZ1 TaxID=765913 RepID=G2E0Y2_9GAMM|nr:hypothetical protein ThidrDRAFT_1820 [Thiorhodococcus drewsii AZ1]